MQEIKDQSQVKTLAIFYYIAGGLGIFFSFFPAIYLVLGILILNGKLPMEGDQDVNSAFIGWLFVIGALVGMIMGFAMSILVIWAGRCLGNFKHRIFCMVMAGLMCLSVPLGTILGVFTFIVLGRDSVRELFDRQGEVAGVPGEFHGD